MNWPYKHGFISGLSVLFHGSMCFFVFCFCFCFCFGVGFPSQRSDSSRSWQPMLQAWQHRILNPLCWARDQTCVPALWRHCWSHCSLVGTPVCISFVPIPYCFDDAVWRLDFFVSNFLIGHGVHQGGHKIKTWLLFFLW